MAVFIKVKCQACGHEQQAKVIDPVFDHTGAWLVGGFAGSRRDFCDKCGSGDVDSDSVVVTDDPEE